jgi:hypothetical protein
MTRFGRTTLAPTNGLSRNNLESIGENAIKHRKCRAVLVGTHIARRTRSALAIALVDRQCNAGFIDTTLCRRGVDRRATGQQGVGQGRTTIVLQRPDGIQCDESPCRDAIAAECAARDVVEEIPAIDLEGPVAVVVDRRIKNGISGDQ